MNRRQSVNSNASDTSVGESGSGGMATDLRTSGTVPCHDGRSLHTQSQREVLQAYESAGGVFINVYMPEFKFQKCVVIDPEEPLWVAKILFLSSLEKELRDGLNYSFYLPPADSRAGCFLDDESCLRDCPMVGPVGLLEFAHKHRISPQTSTNGRKLRQVQSKTQLKQFMEAVKSSRLDKVTKHLNKGLDPNFQDTDSGETPLTQACLLDKEGKLLLTLISGGAHLDFRNRQSLTPMHVAAAQGNIEVLKVLLELGASPDSKDKKGLPPLYHIATTRSGSPLCAQLLLKERASVGYHDENGYTELHQACRNGNASLADLLILYGADLNAQSTGGGTALHLCVVNNEVNCLKTLLLRGANKNIENLLNQAPTHVAMIMGNREMADLLNRHEESSVRLIMEPPPYSLPRARLGASLNASVRAARQLGGGDRRLSTSALQLHTAGMGGDMAALKGSAAAQDMLSRSCRVRSVVGGMDEDDSDSACDLWSLSTRSELGHLSLYLPRQRRTVASEVDDVISAGEDGFWEGNMADREGWFPENLVKEFKMRGGSAGLRKADTVVLRRQTFNELLQRSATGETESSTTEHARVVVLAKGKKGYGFVLRGAKADQLKKLDLQFVPSERMPALQYLDSIEKGSLAEKAGLKPGDFVIEINGVNVVRVSHEEAVQLIKRSSDVLAMKVITVSLPCDGINSQRQQQSSVSNSQPGPSLASEGLAMQSGNNKIKRVTGLQSSKNGCSEEPTKGEESTKGEEALALGGSVLSRQQSVQGKSRPTTIAAGIMSTCQRQQELQATMQPSPLLGSPVSRPVSSSDQPLLASTRLSEGQSGTECGRSAQREAQLPMTAKRFLQRTSLPQLQLPSLLSAQLCNGARLQIDSVAAKADSAAVEDMAGSQNSIDSCSSSSSFADAIRKAAAAVCSNGASEKGASPEGSSLSEDMPPPASKLTKVQLSQCSNSLQDFNEKPSSPAEMVKSMPSFCSRTQPADATSTGKSRGGSPQHPPSVVTPVNQLYHALSKRLASMETAGAHEGELSSLAVASTVLQNPVAAGGLLAVNGACSNSALTASLDNSSKRAQERQQQADDRCKSAPPPGGALTASSYVPVPSQPQLNGRKATYGLTHKDSSVCVEPQLGAINSESNDGRGHLHAASKGVYAAFEKREAAAVPSSNSECDGSVVSGLSGQQPQPADTTGRSAPLPKKVPPPPPAKRVTARPENLQTQDDFSFPPPPPMFHNLPLPAAEVAPPAILPRTSDDYFSMGARNNTATSPPPLPPFGLILIDAHPEARRSPLQQTSPGVGEAAVAAPFDSSILLAPCTTVQPSVVEHAGQKPTAFEEQLSRHAAARDMALVGGSCMAQWAEDHAPLRPFASKHVEMWNVDDVADWLDSVGLSEYRRVFVDNCIEGEALVNLTRSEFKELGIEKVGHRVKFEREVLKLMTVSSV